MGSSGAASRAEGPSRRGRMARSAGATPRLAKPGEVIRCPSAMSPEETGRKSLPPGVEGSAATADGARTWRRPPRHGVGGPTPRSAGARVLGLSARRSRGARRGRRGDGEARPPWPVSPEDDVGADGRPGALPGRAGNRRGTGAGRGRSFPAGRRGRSRRREGLGHGLPLGSASPGAKQLWVMMGAGVLCWPWRRLPGRSPCQWLLRGCQGGRFWSRYWRESARVRPARMVVARIQPAMIIAAASHCCAPRGPKELSCPKLMIGRSRSRV